jgi:hypothetical protein
LSQVGFDADPLAGRTEGAGGVFADGIGVEHHAGDGLLAAADCDRHAQGGVSQLGVVVLAEGEDPARTHVQHRVQEQLALIGDDLCISQPIAGQQHDPRPLRRTRPHRRRARQRFQPNPITIPKHQRNRDSAQLSRNPEAASRRVV